MEKNNPTKYYAPIWIQGILLIFCGVIVFTASSGFKVLFKNINPNFYYDLFERGSRYDGYRMLGRFYDGIMIVVCIALPVVITHFGVQKFENYINKRQFQEGDKKSEL